MKILFEDEALIVCVKEPGVLSEEGKGANLPALVRAHLEDEKAYVGIVHRLDREAGGAILCAKNACAAARLSALLAAGEIRKTYLALLQNPPAEEAGRLCDLLFHDREKNKTYAVSRKRRGVREAALTYRVLRRFSYEDTPCGLLEISLETGRTHQIRAQFAARKSPLLGDRKYGSTLKFPSVALWCSEIAFPHPETGAVLTLCAPLPDTAPWDLIL